MADLTARDVLQPFRTAASLNIDPNVADIDYFLLQSNRGNNEERTAIRIPAALVRAYLTSRLAELIASGDATQAAVLASELAKKADLVGGKVPASQLPSFVDEIMPYPTLEDFPAAGDDHIIYKDKSTNKTYRWDGEDYTEVSSSLALGETDSTAFAGNRGVALEAAVAQTSSEQATLVKGVATKIATVNGIDIYVALPNYTTLASDMEVATELDTAAAMDEVWGPQA